MELSAGLRFGRAGWIFALVVLLGCHGSLGTGDVNCEGLQGSFVHGKQGDGGAGRIRDGYSQARRTTTDFDDSMFTSSLQG